VSQYHRVVTSRVVSTTVDLQSARLYGCFGNVKATAVDLLAYGCINVQLHGWPKTGPFKSL